MHTTQLAIDLAKSVFQVAVSRTPGRVEEQHRLTRSGLTRFFAEREPSTVFLEACGSGHYWGRTLQELGHEVRLLPPSDVARYRDGNKTDRADTKALLEAARNHAIDPVPVKTREQQALTALHRLRSGLLSTRTARINAVRGFLREFGFFIPQGTRAFMTRAPLALQDGDLPREMRTALAEALEEIADLKTRIDGLSRAIKREAKKLPETRFLQSVPGIGILTSTALVAFVGDPHRFPSGRHFASYLGLTPREFSSGHSRRLGRISKRGNRYLRMLLIHGARSALHAARRADEPDELGLWALRLQARSGHNVAAVALANRLARIAWRVWKDQRPFEIRPAA
jgi:transposase